MRIITGKNSFVPIKDLLELTKVDSIEKRIKSLGKNWFRKSCNTEHNPIVKNKDIFKYFPSYDIIKLIFNILKEF